MQLECEPIDSSPIEVDLCTQDAVDRLLNYAGGEVFVPSITAEAVMVTFSPLPPSVPPSQLLAVNKVYDCFITGHSMVLKHRIQKLNPA